MLSESWTGIRSTSVLGLASDWRASKRRNCANLVAYAPTLILQGLVEGGCVEYYQHAIDVFGRVVADVWVDGVWANGHMRRMGHGWGESFLRSGLAASS
jgi:hypothetical protein